MTISRLFYLAPLLLGGCALQDSRIAQNAQSRLIGLSMVDLESCLGVPDQHANFGNTDILTYYATSSSGTSFTLPVVGGIGLNNGGYCHATFQMKDAHVTQILYSGEKNATFAPDAYCAPILRTCMDHLQRTQPAQTPMPAEAQPPAKAAGAT